ncbi:MAG: acyl-CoA dehydrogenase family protein [Cyclobacteriaceae bacterium]|jgi:alkylation response protein AidB-like acyl-CoA dehydrogenase
MSKQQQELLNNLEKVFQNCQERAATYDKEDRFFQEDFDELQEGGYLLMSVPEEFGGYGLNLAECAEITRKLAYHAAPTALALNMHVYWVGLVADLWRQGDKSLEWLLKEAGEGKVFAAGHSESGNDHPVLYSTTEAKKVEGGYTFTGHKMFGSLTPVWDFLGIHAQDNSDPNNPKVIHAFMPRDSKGYEIRKVWDNVLGMRATQSDDTILKEVFIPDQYIARSLPTGFAGIDPFVLGIFAWALIGFANVYYGQAQRVFEMTVGKVQSKKSIALDRPSMAYHSGIQHDISEMVLELEGIGPHLDTTAREWSQGKDYGPAWGVKLVATKCHAVESAWRVVDKALDIVGGYGIFPVSGFERMLRDARLGRLHPANSYLTREILAKGMLGLDLDAQPR